MANNNEKILNLLQTGEQLKPLAAEYLNQLNRRYEWMQEARSRFFAARRQLNTASRELRREAKKEKKNEDLLQSLTGMVVKEASRLYEQYTDKFGRSERGLAELVLLTPDAFTTSYADSMSAYIVKNIKTIRTRRLLSMLEKRDGIKAPDYARATELMASSRELKRMIETNMQGYKQFYENNGIDILNSEVQLVVDKIEDLDANEISSSIHNAISLLQDNPEPERPDGKEIVELLHATRSPQMYISRGYTVLEYSRNVYKSMNNLQRALREKREYIGTKNALERYLNSLDLLMEYYHKSYVQAGGTPRNYHGRHPR